MHGKTARAESSEPSRRAAVIRYSTFPFEYPSATPQEHCRLFAVLRMDRLNPGRLPVIDFLGLSARFLVVSGADIGDSRTVPVSDKKTSRMLSASSRNCSSLFRRDSSALLRSLMSRAIPNIPVTRPSSSLMGPTFKKTGKSDLSRRRRMQSPFHPLSRPLVPIPSVTAAGLSGEKIVPKCFPMSSPGRHPIIFSMASFTKVNSPARLEIAIKSGLFWTACSSV
jgi:hypothetical protein